MDPKHRSRLITEGRHRAGARSMFKAIGFTSEDLAKPLIGVANTWIETMPCNFHLRRLAAKVKEGVRAAGGTPMEFNTIAISDGETMGTEGMRASLVSREVIADSIELVCRGQLFDAVIVLSDVTRRSPQQLWRWRVSIYRDSYFMAARLPREVFAAKMSPFKTCMKL